MKVYIVGKARTYLYVNLRTTVFRSGFVVLTVVYPCKDPSTLTRRSIGLTSVKFLVCSVWKDVRIVAS